MALKVVTKFATLNLLLLLLASINSLMYHCLLQEDNANITLNQRTSTSLNETLINKEANNETLVSNFSSLIEFDDDDVDDSQRNDANLNDAFLNAAFSAANLNDNYNNNNNRNYNKTQATNTLVLVTNGLILLQRSGNGGVSSSSGLIAFDDELQQQQQNLLLAKLGQLSQRVDANNDANSNEQSENNKDESENENENNERTLLSSQSSTRRRQKLARRQNQSTITSSRTNINDISSSSNNDNKNNSNDDDDESNFVKKLNFFHLFDELFVAQKIGVNLLDHLSKFRPLNSNNDNKQNLTIPEFIDDASSDEDLNNNSQDKLNAKPFNYISNRIVFNNSSNTSAVKFSKQPLKANLQRWLAYQYNVCARFLANLKATLFNNQHLNKLIINLNKRQTTTSNKQASNGNHHHQLQSSMQFKATVPLFVVNNNNNNSKFNNTLISNNKKQHLMHKRETISFNSNSNNSPLFVASNKDVINVDAVKDKDVQSEKKSVKSKRASTATTATLTNSAECSSLNKADEFQIANICARTEAQVAVSLAENLPASFAQIQTICANINRLLRQCWPLGTNSLGSVPARQTYASFSANNLLLNCALRSRLRPTIGESMLSRVLWVHNNLCADDDFQKDYLENAQCLNRWSKTIHAERVCWKEYALIQQNIVKPNSMLNNNKQINKQRTQTRQLINYYANNNRQRVARQSVWGSPKTNWNIQNSNEQQQQQLQTTTSTTTASVNNDFKFLCCSFDLFLRCVSRQAANDCGKSSKPFVVKFMSKIGSEDIRMLCNSKILALEESTPQSTTSGGNIKSTYNEQHQGKSNEFIDDRYCKNPTVYANIQTLLNKQSQFNRNLSSIQESNNQLLINSNSKDLNDAYLNLKRDNLNTTLTTANNQTTNINKSTFTNTENGSKSNSLVTNNGNGNNDVDNIDDESGDIDSMFNVNSADNNSSSKLLLQSIVGKLMIICCSIVSLIYILI